MKEDIIAIIDDIKEDGHDFEHAHVVFTWKYNEHEDVTCTLFLGPPVVETEEDEFTGMSLPPQLN